MKIGMYDEIQELENIKTFFAGRHSESIDLAHSIIASDNPKEVVVESLRAFGCNDVQIQSLMSKTKDLRNLNGCSNLDSDVHVLRAYLGRCAYRNRLRSIDTFDSYSRDILERGIAIIPFTKYSVTLESELATKNAALSKDHTNMISLSNSFKSCNEFMKNVIPYLREACAYSESVLDQELRNTVFAQRVLNSPDDNDVQKVLHQDTWHDAWKFWYFPRKVMKGEGPFRISPYSHGLSVKRLDYIKEFASPKKWEDWRSYGHYEGSWRASDAEVSDMGCETIDVECDAGTLVIASVYAFHARGLSDTPKERISLHGSVRINPW
jgi:hypothetical protein